MTVDQKKRAAIEQKLTARDEQYRRVVELAGDIICRTDEQGRFTFCNQAALTSLHFSESEVIGRSWLKLIRQDKRRAAERFYIRQFARRQKNTYYELPLIDGHGRERWVGQSVQLVIEKDKITGFQAIAREITERKRAEFELQKSRKFVERIAATTPGILYVYDLVERRNVYSNREVITVLGYRPEEIRNTQDLDRGFYHPDDQGMIEGHHEAMRNAQDGEIRRLEYRARHADGHWVWLSGRETPFERGPDGLVKQVVGISQDITARKAAQDKLAYQANYDALTGLSNRHYFWAGLQSLLRRASIERSVTALCLFDIDHFKDINDRFGHAAGDEVLEAIGNIVRAEVRSTDIAGRLGGDEFCFALPRAESNECARVAESAGEARNAGFRHGGGIALFRHRHVRRGGIGTRRQCEGTDGVSRSGALPGEIRRAKPRDGGRAEAAPRLLIVSTLRSGAETRRADCDDGNGCKSAAGHAGYGSEPRRRPSRFHGSKLI